MILPPNGNRYEGRIPLRFYAKVLNLFEYRPVLNLTLL